jgi:hypothetical protein
MNDIANTPPFSAVPTPGSPAQTQTPAPQADPWDAQRRRAYLVQMLRSTQQQPTRTPVSLGANLLAEALLLHRLNQLPAAAAAATPPGTPPAAPMGPNPSTPMGSTP